MRKTSIASLAFAFALAGLAGSAQAILQVSADITSATANDTWGDAAGEDVIILDGPIFVRDGGQLTILPGVIVRGQPRTAAVQQGVTAGTPGVLVVTQTGRLVADGTRNSPIIFTTAATDNNGDGVADGRGVACPTCADPWNVGDTFLDDTPATAPLAPLDGNGNSNVSLWGGLVVLGSAPTNNADKCGGVDWGQCTVEGLTFPGFTAAQAAYGGVLPHDNSGSLTFISVRHAGDELGLGNELNGITLAGVGDGTRLENVEVYANFDDGIEWFGGTVNGKNLHVAFVGDDMFDADEGYTGVNQFLFGVMPFFNENGGGSYGSASGDKGAELDGDNFRPDNVALNDNTTIRINADQSVVDQTPWPLSNPAFYNMTIIGSTLDAGQDFTPTSVAGTNRGIQVRNGFAGEIFNAIVVNTGTRSGIELDTGVGDGFTGFDAIDNVSNGALHPRTDGLISLVCSTLDDTGAPAAADLDVIANGDTLALALGGSAASANVVNGAFSSLVNEDQSFDPQGNAAGKLVASLKPAPIDPRPAGGFPPVGIAGCPAPQGTGLDRSATYRGAFAIGGTLWTNGWTVLDIAGLL